eukprot:1570774-Amphidinium_carterae.1
MVRLPAPAKLKLRCYPWLDRRSPNLKLRTVEGPLTNVWWQECRPLKKHFARRTELPAEELHPPPPQDRLSTTRQSLVALAKLLPES